MSKLYIDKLNLNINELRKSCLLLDQLVNIKFSSEETDYKIDSKTPLSTSVATSYNLFLFPYKGFHELYEQIRIRFKESCVINSPHYIHGWVNVYNSNQNLGWHRHWSGVTNSSIHGFFCVQSEGSFTEYKFDDGEEINVKSEDNLLVMGNSNNNLHKTSEWSKVYPRITIAFDIHPIENLNEREWINHWVPI